MLEKEFFEKFCFGGDNAAAIALVDFKNSIMEFLNAITYKLTNTNKFNTQDKEDIIQEVLIKLLLEKRVYLCSKNLKGDFGKNGFKYFFLTTVRNEVVDRIRKRNKEEDPIDYTAEERKRAKWEQDYTTAKEERMLTIGKLSPMQLETTKVFSLHNVPDNLKLIVVLNILLKKNNWHFEEMNQMGVLQHQIPYNEVLNNYEIEDIYALKTTELLNLLQLESEVIDVLRDTIRKYKYKITRKLQRNNLWKHIHLQT